MSARHSVEHDYRNPYRSDVLDRIYDLWPVGDFEVERRYVGDARHRVGEIPWQPNLDTEGYWAGWRAAADHLDEIPGPMVESVASALLRVTPDPDDDRAYDGGFRAALRAALP